MALYNADCAEFNWIAPTCSNDERDGSRSASIEAVMEGGREGDEKVGEVVGMSGDEKRNCEGEEDMLTQVLLIQGEMIAVWIAF